MKNLRRITIFLASPGDVNAERGHVRSVVEELNRTVASANGLHIEVVGWDTDAMPALGGDGQAVINGQIADMSQYDVFVGIMWNRFGSPTPRAGSGTEEEFGRALEHFEASATPHIMLYFGQMPASLESQDQLDQKAKVVGFRSKVEKMGLTWRYPDPDAFRELFRQHLTKWILSLPSPNPPEATHSAPVTLTKEVPTTAAPAPAKTAIPTNWVLLGERFYKAGAVREREGEIVVTISPQGSHEDEALRQSVGRRSTVRFAYQNLAGAAEVVSGERVSASDGDRWEVTLRLSRQDQSGGLGEFSYNGRSALQLAEMRARLILLDESPTDSNDMLLGGMVSGLGNTKVERGVLPGLWQSLGGDAEAFLPLARLLAVYYLKTTGTVEQILRLDIGPIEKGGVRVKLEGLRSKVYVNRDPEQISIEGVCPLGLP